MTLLAAVLGLALIAIGLLDAFETVVLPRRVARRLRLSNLFYLATWASTAWDYASPVPFLGPNSPFTKP